jgi:hypothetical protein
MMQAALPVRPLLLMADILSGSCPAADSGINICAATSASIIVGRLIDVLRRTEECEELEDNIQKTASALVWPFCPIGHKTE